MLKRLYTLSGILTLCGIGFVIILIWQLLELITMGEITRSKADIIMAVILAYSLFANYYYFTEDKEKKNGEEIK